MAVVTILTITNSIISSQCYKFAEDVLSGKLISGKKRILACQRFIDELDKMSDPSYPWTFDIKKGYRPINFIEKFCVPTKGNYERMELLPWQHFIEANIYGWISKETGLRRFREVLIIVGAGNGKSTVVTGNAIFGASKDGERGAEVYTLANSKDQARITFDECGAQIDVSPMLRKHFRVTRDGIYFDPTRSKIQPLATDSTNLAGRNVHMAIFDEIKDYVNWILLNTIKGKTKKRRQPIIIYITTLGQIIDGPLMDLYVLGSKILEGDIAVLPRAADRMLVYIDEIDEDDDPENIECWGKANPSLGKLILLDDLIDEWERVKHIPAERSFFINEQLNVFTSVDELSYLQPETIRKNNKEIDMSTLVGLVCYAGLDLAETEDFTSACLEFELPDKNFFVLSHSWVPEKKVRADNEKLDWINLQNEGLLTIVPGDYVHYDYIYEWFLEKAKLYKIESIGYDPAKAFWLADKLRTKGFVLNEVRQGELTLTAPLDHLKERFLDGNIIHNNNRMFNWYLGNVKLTKRGANATYIPTRQNKYRKIDGFAAFLDAHTEYLRSHPLQIPPDKVLSHVIKLN